MDTKRSHGGDWAGYAAQYGHAPLDFSANISPLGVPAGVRAAICAAAETADRYPDPECRALRAAIARHEGVPMEQILCGNGAAELIFRVAQALRPRRALVTAPSFTEYEAALSSVDCAVTRWPLDAAFRLDDGILDAITPETDVVFLSQPNNPSGVCIGRGLLERIARRCTERGCLLVLDECFIDFLNAPEAVTMKDRLNDFPQLLILRAFTKFYAMAGVRLGYALCADGALLSRMQEMAQPWSVSSLAAAAGVAALEERDYAARLRALIAEERPWLKAQLQSLGLFVAEGEANFLLFRSPRALDAPLRERGILLRGCVDFAGLDGTWYRTAVRTREENARLIAAIREVLT